jgi:hypothetical protein
MRLPLPWHGESLWPSVEGPFGSDQIGIPRLRTDRIQVIYLLRARGVAWSVSVSS